MASKKIGWFKRHWPEFQDNLNENANSNTLIESQHFVVTLVMTIVYSLTNFVKTCFKAIQAKTIVLQKKKKV